MPAGQGETMNRKIIQVVFRNDGATFAVADDGTVWRLDGEGDDMRWRLARWPELPQG